MANYCPNCGASVSGGVYCPTCGYQINQTAGNVASVEDYPSSASSGIASAAAGALGTLVAVSLVGGLTRELYYYGGRYYLDPYCRSPFGTPHLIMGRHRPIMGRPVPPPPPPMGRPPMGRPVPPPPMGRPPMGRPVPPPPPPIGRPPMGGPGPRGPMGGPGGPGGRRGR